MSYRIRIAVRDGNGKTSETSLRVADESQGGSYALALYRAQAVVSAIQGLTDAYVYQFTIEREYALSGVSVAGPSSNIYRKLQLFFREDGSLQGSSITIPSYRTALPFDANGPYRAIRLQRQAVVLSGMLASVQGLVQGTVAPNGDAFPTYFRVGTTSGVIE